MMNWADAVRHYDSSTALDPTNGGARQNRETTMIYLRKLRELLEQEKKDADKSMPQQGQGQGQPQPGQGQGNGEGEDGEGGKGDQEKPGGEGGEEKDRDGDGGDKKKDDSKSKGPGDPNETPEDRARRLLSDNADLEKGPLTPGRIEQRRPKKDW
jgi:hypothetical protein